MNEPEWSAAERQLRAEFPVVIELPVQWAELDAFRHVNHAVFLTYFEGARFQYLLRIGFGGSVQGDSIGPILASAQARYRRPLLFPDTVVVGARVTEVQEDRFTQEYRLVSRALADVAATGSALLVSYDYEAGAKVPLPAAVRAAIARVEGAPG